MGTRETALRVLMSCRNNHAWADAALKAQLGRDGLVGPEAALCSRLVYGVVQNQQLLDFYLSAYCSQKPDHLQPPLLEILRLGAYQILYLDRVPDSAAVNTSVELAKISGRGQASGLVNAVLRKIAQNKTALPPIPERDEAKYLSIRYSHPKWLVKRLLSILGREETEAFLAANNDTPPLTVQVNPLKTDTEGLIKELEGWGVTAKPHPWVPGCLELTGAGDLTTLAPFREGKLLVQDPAARLVSLIAGVQPGQKVLDLCAAPGGKSLLLIEEMQDEGRLVSCDVSENRVQLIRKAVERMGFAHVEPRVSDGTRPDADLPMADAILVDAPCSGLGILAKKPDIRYKDVQEFSALPEIQRAILENSARYVKRGGLLVYSTCTILPEENEQVTDDFLKAHDEFTYEAFSLPNGVSAPGHLTLWPQRDNTDGFYLSRMRRKTHD